MKSILLKLFIIGLCVSFFPIQAIAGGYTGWRTVSAVEQRECVQDKGFQITFSPAHDNPDGCSNNAVVELDCSLETYKVNVAVVLTAFAAGQEVRAWVSGCDGEGQAKLKSIQSRPQN